MLIPQEIQSFDRVVVHFSGSAESLAILLNIQLSMVECPEKLEAVHYLIDGREGSSLMDFPVTEDYVRKVCAHLNVPVSFAWRRGGFEAELNRFLVSAEPVMIDRPLGTSNNRITETFGGNGKKRTRQKWPLLSKKPRKRWCTQSLKRDVESVFLNNGERFKNIRTLYITADRDSRKSLKKHSSSIVGKKFSRDITQWRPMNEWTIDKHWEIIKLASINPHPAYYAGFPTIGCMNCIFSNKDRIRTSGYLNIGSITRMVSYESRYDRIQWEGAPIFQRSASGTCYPELTQQLQKLLQNSTFTGLVKATEWKWPTETIRKQVEDE